MQLAYVTNVNNDKPNNMDWLPPPFHLILLPSEKWLRREEGGSNTKSPWEKLKKLKITVPMTSPEFLISPSSLLL